MIVGSKLWNAEEHLKGTPRYSGGWPSPPLRRTPVMESEVAGIMSSYPDSILCMHRCSSVPEQSHLSGNMFWVSTTLTMIQVLNQTYPECIAKTNVMRLPRPLPYNNDIVGFAFKNAVPLSFSTKSL